MFDFVRPKDRALWNAGADEFTDTYLSDFLGAVGELYSALHIYADMGGVAGNAEGEPSDDATGIMSLLDNYETKTKGTVQEALSETALQRLKETLSADNEDEWADVLKLDHKSRLSLYWEDKKVNRGSKLIYPIPLSDRIRDSIGTICGSPLATGDKNVSPGMAGLQEPYFTFDFIPPNRVPEIRFREMVSQNRACGMLAEIPESDRAYQKGLNQSQFDRLEKGIRTLSRPVAIDVARAFGVDPEIVLAPISWKIFGGRRAYAPGWAWPSVETHTIERHIDGIIDAGLTLIEHLFAKDVPVGDLDEADVLAAFRLFFGGLTEQFQYIDEVAVYRAYQQYSDTRKEDRPGFFVAPIYSHLWGTKIMLALSNDYPGNFDDEKFPYLAQLIVDDPVNDITMLGESLSDASDDLASKFGYVYGNPYHQLDPEKKYLGPACLAIITVSDSGEMTDVVWREAAAIDEVRQAEMEAVGAKQEAFETYKAAQNEAIENLPSQRALREKIEKLSVSAKSGRKMPVLGFAQGSVERLNMTAGEPIDHVDTPPYLESSETAYAIEVRNNSMSPVYKDGDLLFVDPSERVVEGDDVVVEMIDDDEVYGMVKQLTYKSDAFIVLNQYNVPDGIDGSFKVEAPKFGKIHKVVGRQMVKRDRRL